MITRVIPGILEKDWVEIEKKIEEVRPFAKVIHIDLIDGKFSPNTTFMDPEPFRKYTKDIEFELHMMVEEPINYLKSFSDAGFRRFIGQIEKMSDQTEFVASAQRLGEVGLAVDEPTSVDQIKVPFEDLDLIFFMTVKAGESGQKFNRENIKKIENIKNSVFIPIEVDGGIENDTILISKNAGASYFVATSAIFSGGNPQENYSKLMQKIGQGGDNLEV